MKNKKTKKYLTGGKVNNYIENPGTELTKLQIMMSKAKQEVNEDPLLNTLDTIGPLLTGIMGSIDYGEQGEAQEEKAAMGGTLGDPPTKQGSGKANFGKSRMRGKQQGSKMFQGVLESIRTNPVVKALDPTGTTSWADVPDALKGLFSGHMTGEQGLNLVSAVPAIGKAKLANEVVKKSTAPMRAVVSQVPYFASKAGQISDYMDVIGEFVDLNNLMPKTVAQKNAEKKMKNSKVSKEKLAMGGTTKKQTEVERGEVVERPDGTLLDFSQFGKKHESGGIPLSNEEAPGGSEVHSARVKIGGKTMAEIKLGFEKKAAKLDKLMAENPTDRTIKKTKELFDSGYKKVNERNMMIQNMLKQADNYMASGGTIEDLDEDSLYDLQEYADQNGIELEEAYEELYGESEEDQEDYYEDPEEEYVDDEDVDDEEFYTDEEDTEEYALGGSVGPIPKRGTRGIARSSSDNPLSKWLKGMTDEKEPTTRLKNLINDRTFNGYLNNLGITDFDINDKSHVKNFQNKLGLAPKDQIGIFGPKTFSAYADKIMDDKYIKENTFEDSVEDKFQFEDPIELSENELTPLNPNLNTSLQKESERMNGLLPKTLMGIPNSTEQEDSSEGFLGGMSIGDLTGMLGTAYGSIAGRNNTEANRAGDKPNVNSFLNYGEEGIRTMNKAGEGLEYAKDEAMKNLQLNRNAGLSRGRNSARSINTSRALDLATDNAISTQEGKVLSSNAQQVSQLMQGKARLQMDQDAKRMTGEQLRDMNDRRDRDNYYTNKGADTQSLATGLQQIGKQLNNSIERDMKAELLSEMSEFFGIDISASGVKIGNKKPAKTTKTKKQTGTSLLNKIFGKNK